MTSSPVLWYASRATGMVSLALFTLVMVLGIAVRRRGRLPGLPRFGTVALHRSVTLLATVFLALHVVTVVGDSYVSVSLLDVVVPWVGSYHPFWLGLGTVALDLVVALTVTSLLRARIGHRTWRALHWLAYACWPVALVHGLGIGTDSGSGWGLGLALGCVAAVGAALAYRLRAEHRPTDPRQILAVATRRA